jgi:hypothetical protein
MIADQSLLRLAVIGTPRSGNTWLRALLAELYDLEQIPVHFPEHIDWDHLPRRCVIQIHWHPVGPFVGTLERHGLRVVVLARHPFDVLLSWLNYAYYVHFEGYCKGSNCDECPIVGVLPRSDAFLNYVSGGLGRHLLSFSPAWWNRRGVTQVRYEGLVAEPDASLGRLVNQIGEPPRRPVGEIVESTSIGRMKPSQDVWQYHYWQGQPCLWRQMIPAEQARVIARSVPEPFEVLGYACDPDDALGPDQADQNWLRLQLDSTREHLSLERLKHRKKTTELAALQEELRRTNQLYRDEQRSHAETCRILAATQGRSDAMEGRLESQQGPNSH